ncbi:MAG: ABC transporter permease [Candidatus Heimdallarchaeota archaeon]|nr:ABC transporter permease [Candidatus Heimdallarchaeota archaeon]
MSEIKQTKFSFNRVFVVSKRVLVQFKRDHRTFGMMVIFPIMFMLVFGVVLSGEVKHVPIMIEITDEGFTHPISGDVINLGDEILAEMILSEYVDIKDGTYLEGVDEVETASIVASILIPSNFTNDVLAGNNASIKIYIDGTKPQLRQSVYKALQESIEEVAGGTGLDFDEDLAFGVGELSGLDYSIPAVMAYILTFLILILAVLTAIREDVNRTKLRLFTTPLLPSEKILGYGLALSVFAILESVLVIAIALFIFDSQVYGSIPLLFVSGFLYGIAHIFLAFFLSNFAKNEFQSVQLAILIAIPSMALSGMMIPTFTFPTWLEVISKAIPMTYGVRTFEGIMLRGWGITELWLEFTIIAICSVLFFFLALISSSDKSRD